ncbi:MAG TPA: DUF2089 family protein [Clostridia bacterium]|nr:DUF2089 family protein [Clostridiales bacterium]HHX50052.1 DUF2089 family protein [Clostridia bacterium]
MVKDLVAICPRCNEKLIAKHLRCDNCELELNGNFPLSNFDYLTTDELDFVEYFLKAQGNFKTIQIELEMSYPAVKKKFNDILDKLNLSPINSEEKNEVFMITTGVQPITETDSLVVKRIKEKLNASGGRALIPLYSGGLCEIGFDPNGNGLVSPKIPPANQLTWQAFEAAVEVVVQNDGKAVKGKARSGARLGSDDLPLNSVEGYIAHKVHGARLGDTAFGPGFVIAAILDWAEVCHNERGYLTINPKFMSELKIKEGGVEYINQLEKRFNEDMKNIYLTAKKELGYNATRFLQLLSDKGGVKAAKILIAKDGRTDGFEILRNHKRLDLSVEAHVLKPEYNELFTDEERKMCRERLERYGFKI